MARTQKRKVGSRNYKTAYTENSLTSAIHAVNSSSMSIRKASKEFKIPFGTLRNKIKGLHSGKVGRPFRLETIDCLKFKSWKFKSWKPLIVWPRGEYLSRRKAFAIW